MVSLSGAQQSCLRRAAVLVGAVSLAVLAGCKSPGVPVTGANAESPDASFTQSETSITTSYAGKYIVVVAYNDETNESATIQYTSTTRKILAGASLMGWSYSLDRGKSWTHGGKVKPPKDWAVLWGDPAVTTSEGAYQYVFMSNLAIPSSKMPAGGINGSVIVSGDDSYIGGACIARSVDGGITFKNYQCVSRTEKNNVPNSEKGHFYDGGSMASSRKGEIYAAFVDVTTDQIDVYRAPDEEAQFALLPPPFPTLAIKSHPRLRVNLADGTLYVAAQTSDGTVYMNRYKGGQWGQPVAAAFGVLYPCVAFESNACTPSHQCVSGKLCLRTGPQFSFAIGAASDSEGTDAIRIMTTQWSEEAKRFYVEGYACPLSLSPHCSYVPQWGTTPGNLNSPGDQFAPTVAAWPGFIGLPPAWQAAYLDRSGNPAGTVTLKRGSLAYLPGPPAKPIFVPFSLITNMTVCPDDRGYWGDYDDLAFIGFEKESTTAEFLRTMSDSSLGCAKRWTYTSQHLHIRGGTFK
ncbi:MAG: hypothetical protein U1F33_01970 [Alphaproteobacteria bacterium]